MSRADKIIDAQVVCFIEDIRCFAVKFEPQTVWSVALKQNLLIQTHIYVEIIWTAARISGGVKWSVGRVAVAVVRSCVKIEWNSASDEDNRA